ncbi:DUF2227 family putative metal-binding protein [Deinococcus sp. YIM 77859]|uniref:DUF2227 family putative metal-binding protein n=1 Tax=Deinococcus sp. YIM 77859 TaxID=1540221 RepID=UPI000557DEC2|nr:DUF2227 family putative metal-binding protein [Deinococcus sp. YIM 77859]
MPSGDVHTAVNLGALAVLSAAGLLLSLPQDTLIAFGGGMLLSTLLITPDLDLAGHVRVRARRNWGLWGELWRPLSLFVRHRGVTHTFVRGPLLLLGYALAVMGVMLSVLRWLMRSSPLLTLPWTGVSGQSVFAALAGYLVGYWLHVWLDGYRPWHKGRC